MPVALRLGLAPAVAVVTNGLELLDLLTKLLVGDVREQLGEAVPREPGDAQRPADADQRDCEVVADPANRLDGMAWLDEPKAGDPHPAQITGSAPDQGEGRAVDGRADLVGGLAPGGDVDDRLPDDTGLRVALAELAVHDDCDQGRTNANCHDDGGGHDAPFCCARV